jgi:hypothetical protein
VCDSPGFHARRVLFSSVDRNMVGVKNTYVNAGELVKHPVLGGVKTLQVLLGSTSLDCPAKKLVIKR